MKKILILLMVFINMEAKAQTSVMAESQAYFSKTSKLTPFDYVQAEKYFKNSNFGLFIFTAATNTWGEMYAGPNYTFKGNNPQHFIEVGAAIGIESNIHPYRTAAYAFFNFSPDSTGKNDKGKWQGLLDAEYGGSGYWYLGFITYNISNRLAIGIHAQSFTSVWGPRFQYQKGNFMIYTVPGYSLERKEPGNTTGARYYF